MKSKLQITTIQAAFTIVCFCFIQSTALFSQAISEWRSVTSGDFTNPGGTVWEKNVSGTWTLQAAAAKPSGSCNVTIRAGHTVSLSSTTSILGLTIEAGAVFNSTAAATAPITFRVGTSSSADITAGFTRNTTVIQNDGTFGAAANAAGANGGINIEVGKECQTLTLQGTGICNIGRTRFLYPAYQASTFNINQSMWLGYAAGTSLTTYYNNAANTATESNTINLAAGKTVTLVAGASFHGSVSGVTPPTNPQGTMTYNISGTLDLSATTSGGLQTSTAGAPVLNLTIKNGGIMKLGTSFGAYRGANTGSINMTIESGGLIDGSLLTSGFTNNSSTLNTGSTFFLIQGTGAFKQPVSTSTLFPIGYDATHYNPITLNNGGGVVFSASVVSGNTPSGLANATKAINRTWTITPATTPATADVAFGYSTADANAACIPANGMQLMSYSGSVWGVAKTSVTPSVGIGTDFQVAYSGVSFASTTFTLSNVPQIPVELMTFKGHTQDANNVLEWATATELNNQEFVIERSLNGVDFQKIGLVKGAGNSNQINNYTFTDVNAPLSIGYYQLRQIDLNGRETVSKSITIAQKGRNKEGVVRLYPSVTNAILTVDFVANTESTFKVMDLLGRTVLSKNNKNSEGLSSTQLDVSALSSGMYILSFESATTKMVQKFEKR